MMDANDPQRLTRRRFVGQSSALSAALALSAPRCLSAQDSTAKPKSAITGHAKAVAAGNAVLQQGGNAVDAIVAGALVAGVVALPSTGIGGYGGAAIVGGLADGKVSAIDFNGTAPMALRENQYQAMGESGRAAQMTGWTSVGVPGVLAGLYKLQVMHGTWKWSRVLEPAIRIAFDGFALNDVLARQIVSAKKAFTSDPGSRKLFLPGGNPPTAGEMFFNSELGKMLEVLAKDENVEAFYRGRFAEQIADQCQRGGGWLAKEDLNRFEARTVEPIQLYWGDSTLHTLPPTSGGMTVLQALHTLQALDWPNAFAAEQRDIAFVEAMRQAWQVRLSKLGDPQFFHIPKQELLSRQTAQQAAQQVLQSIAQGRPMTGTTDGRSAGGTIHLNAVDESGLSVALTFTHGDGFGSHVTVYGLGLLLGHGLSRFDPEPGRANSPASGKRPLHNMCPTLVTRGGRVELAIGATGGRRIVSAVTNVLANYLGNQMSLEAAVKEPRLHTEGGLELEAEYKFSHASEMNRFGYVVSRTNGIGNLTAIQRKEDGALEVSGPSYNLTKSESSH